jgi:hypothetical protein
MIAIISAASTPGSMSDAFRHAIFLGFVVAMIFGHAPIVSPAILGKPLPFTAMISSRRRVFPLVPPACRLVRSENALSSTGVTARSRGRLAPCTQLCIGGKVRTTGKFSPLRHRA